MAKASDLICRWQQENPGRPWFALEYFPPKSDLAVLNLYERIGRMSALEPLWIDVTWGPGGSTAEKTLDICRNALKCYGLNVMMHLTCTNIEGGSLYDTLIRCKQAGIVNILALRGDAPTAVEEARPGGCFRYAVDLVRYIKEHFGNTFCIGVAAYPEGHAEASSREADMTRLKEKVDAGAELIVTQHFYDNGEYLQFVDRAREAGIGVPIIPGVMPIASFANFSRMAQTMKLPQGLLEDLEAVKGDEQRLKDFGLRHAGRMCRELAARGVPGFHFYTLNAESVGRVVTELGLAPADWAPRRWPWQRSAEPRRTEEAVRPVFWAQRPQSYMRRSADWRTFPNGRWSGGAAGDLAAYAAWPTLGPESAEKFRADRRKIWGAPASAEELAGVFAGYFRGEVPRLPWCASPAAPGGAQRQLAHMSALNALVTRSEARVNGASSTDPALGWGPADGLVYQKANLECFLRPDLMDKLASGLRAVPSMKYAAVNRAGDLKTNLPESSVTAISWGVFPCMELVQPTVGDRATFLAWKDEAFALWDEWCDLYERSSVPGQLLKMVQNSYYLVWVVDNNFVSGDLIDTVLRILKS